MQNPRQKSYIYSSRSLSGPTAGPVGFFGRAVAFVVGLGVLAVSFFLGAIVLAFFVGFALIIGLIISGRLWWLKRKMQVYQAEHGDLEGDYTVVDDKSKETDRSQR